MAKGLELLNLAILRNGVAFAAVNAAVGKGQILTIMGPSGVGKSSLLAAIVGALPDGLSQSGDVQFDGESLLMLPPHQRRVGILFQDDLLFPHMSVAENLAFGLAEGGTRVERRERIEEALADVGLGGFGDRDPATLSGGQKARISLIRVLLSRPRALLLDEPFSRLDAGLRGHIRELVFLKARENALPVVLVTHDQSDAYAAGGQIWRLEIN